MIYLFVCLFWLWRKGPTILDTNEKSAKKYSFSFLLAISPSDTVLLLGSKEPGNQRA